MLGGNIKQKDNIKQKNTKCQKKNIKENLSYDDKIFP